MIDEGLITNELLHCSYCGALSKRVHSRYQRRFQDLPIIEKIL
ncbi:transposase family protein [Bacillus cereus]